jgi:formyltetrahydrofolate deformylase
LQARPRQFNDLRQLGMTSSTTSSTTSPYVLTLSCPDRLGLVHSVSGFLAERDCNIEEAAQYNDQGTGLFFMRVQFAAKAISADELRSQTHR